MIVLNLIELYKFQLKNINASSPTRYDRKIKGIKPKAMWIEFEIE